MLFYFPNIWRTLPPSNFKHLFSSENSFCFVFQFWKTNISEFALLTNLYCKYSNFEVKCFLQNCIVSLLILVNIHDI